MKGESTPALATLRPSLASFIRLLAVTSAIHASAAVAQTTSAALPTGDEISPDTAQMLRQFKQLSTVENIEYGKLRTRQLVKRAQDYSAAIREAQYNVLAATQDVNAAAGARMPQVFANGQSAFSYGDIARASQATGKPGLTLTAQVPVYDWGRIAASIRQREAQQDGAYARVNLANRQIALESTTNCLELSKQRALLTAAVEYRLKIQDLLGRLDKIVEADPGREGEMVQTKSRLLQAKSSEETLRSKVGEQRIRIERQLGPDQSSLCDNIGYVFLQKIEVDQISQSLKVHPQLKVASADYEAQLRNLDVIAASRKPQVLFRAEHAPMALSVNNDYQQTLSFAISAPLYDGRTLESTQRAALERANGLAERIDLIERQLDTDLRERRKSDESNLRRAEEFVGLIEINNRVRQDFFIQWSALGRRTLFELLAIEAEQFSLQSGYYSALYDGMTANAYIMSLTGALTEALQD